MDLNQIINLVSRWLHIIPVIILVGGTVFMRFSLVPAANENEASAELREGIRKRWAKLIMLSILFLLVTGLYNAVAKIMAYELPGTYHGLVMVKLLVGLGIFYLASVLSGRSATAQKFRERETHWLNILCALMLVMVLVAGYMKSLATDAPKKVRGETEAAQVFHQSENSSVLAADASRLRNIDV